MSSDNGDLTSRPRSEERSASSAISRAGVVLESRDHDTPATAALPSHALATLAPRTTTSHCSTGQYDALLESYRRYVMASTVVAIARAWDSGRLTFQAQGEPPFASEVFGLAGRRAGLAEPYFAEALDTLQEAADAVVAARSALAGRQSPLDILCAEHAISETGEIVLLFITAPALWGEVTRAYGILANDPARPACDEHLLWRLLEATHSRRDIARELDPDSPLVHRGVVLVEEGRRPFQSLVANPVIVKLLGGSPVDADVEDDIARVPATVTLDRFMAPVAVIDRALADLAASPPGQGRVVVRGRGGSGRRTLLATLAQLAGRTLATIDAARLIRENRLRALAELLQRAHLRGWLPCVDGLDTIGSEDKATRSAVREILRVHPGPLAVRLSHHVPPPLLPGYVLIDLPASTITERARQWTEIATSVGLVASKFDDLAARFIVGPGTIRNVVTAVARVAPRGPHPDPHPAIENALRQHLETRISAVATRVTRLASWSQIILPADIQDSITELIARIRHRRTVYDTWGFDQVLTTSRGITALFQGGPGTGKTLVASALANELGLDLYRIDLSRVLSKWVGETEQNLAQVFDAVEEGQALILFDEADSLFAHRTEVRTSTDRYANIETNYLLQRLDSFEGIAVLTTNLDTAIDPAFKRRLTCRLTFPFPDQETRERLWQVHLPEQLPRAGNLDLAGLARRYPMSGGYIRNAAVRAAFLAAQDQTPLSQFHLERAIRAEFREAGKHAEPLE